MDKKKRLIRLRNVPYFGRIDLKEKVTEKPEAVYVGLHNLMEENKENLVYDWSAPISSMFYDFEPFRCGTFQDFSLISKNDCPDKSVSMLKLSLKAALMETILKFLSNTNKASLIVSRTPSENFLKACSDCSKVC